MSFIKKIFTLSLQSNLVTINKCSTIRKYSDVWTPQTPPPVCPPSPCAESSSLSSSSKPPEYLRPIRQEPGKVQFGFIPEEWFLFFVPKTGYTGFYTFIFTTSTYLISKEIYVLDHEFYNGLSMAILTWYAVRTAGPKLAAWLDKEIDLYEKYWQITHKENEDRLKILIEHEIKLQKSAEGQLMLIEFKRTNVKLQLEAEKRRKQMELYREVKRRLDYQVAVGKVWERFLWWNRLDYIFHQVRDTAPPEIKDYVRDMSVTDIAGIIKKTTCQKS